MSGENYTTNRTSNTTKPLLQLNPLHSAATYNTLFTLSGLTENEIRTHDFLKNPVHDIIARSGGIGNPNISRDPFASTAGLGSEDKIVRDAYKNFSSQYSDSIDILTRGHDIFFENVNILSTVGPNTERNLANFTKMEFELHEPYGITFIEKVRAATALNGFRDYQDAPLLLTIEFKGYDERGRPLAFNTKQGGLTRKIPILIVRVDFDVNEGGAKYTVTAVPYTDLAFDDRFKFPRTKIPAKSDNAVEWARQVEKALLKQMQDEIDEKKRVVIDEYKFEIDRDVIVNGLPYKNERKSQHHTAATDEFFNKVETLEAPADPIAKGSEADADSNTALTKFFEDAIRNSFGYQSLAESFWTAYLRSADVDANTKEELDEIISSQQIQDIILRKPYVNWFKIKTTVETFTNEPLDPVTKMHRKRIIFQAIPYKIHVLKLIGPGLSLGNVDWSRQVRKEYNYIYTGENTDVQGLRINYKTAYYMRNVRGDDETRSQSGKFQFIEDTFNKVFGRETDPEPTLPLRQYPSNTKGRSTVNTTAGESVKAQEFYDYLTNPEADMLRIELDILGDPAYICQDIYTPIHQDRNTRVGEKDSVFDVQTQSFNADQFMPIIFVKYRLPDDLDEKEGTMFSGKKRYRDENLFFSGAYQVVKVDSKFDNGQFLQTLTCVRMNNQQGVGAPAVLVNSAAKDLGEITKDVDTRSNAQTQPNPLAGNGDTPRGVFDAVTDQGNNSA